MENTDELTFREASRTHELPPPLGLRNQGPNRLFRSLLPVALLMSLIVPGAVLAGAFGTYVSDPAPLNTDASSDAGWDGVVSVAADGMGTWVAVWQRQYLEEPPWDVNLLMSVSRDNGATWDAPHPVTPETGSLDSFDVYPSLTYDGQGTWGMVWNCEGLCFSRSTDGATTWSTPFRIGWSGASEFPIVAGGGAGTWIAAVETDASGIAVYRSDDNGLTWNWVQMVGSSPDHRPRIATDGAGAWIIVWHSHNTGSGFDSNDAIVFTRSTDNGVSWSSHRALSGDSYPTDRFPSITVDGRGNWLVAWKGGSQLCSSSSRDRGATWSARDCQSIAPFYTASPLASAADSLGHAVVVWSTNLLGGDTDIAAVKSADLGQFWTQPQLLNTNADADFGEDNGPTVATDGEGNWLAAWSSTEDHGGATGSDSDVLFSRWAFCEIRLSRESVTEIHFSPSVPSATFDLVTGHLTDLRSQQGYFNAECMGSFAQTPVTEPLPSPSPGESFYYLAHGTGELCAPLEYGEARGPDPDPRDDLVTIGPCP